jgi:hypothetical protein
MQFLSFVGYFSLTVDGLKFERTQYRGLTQSDEPLESFIVCSLFLASV